MSAITAFEVQSFRNGDWRIETITDSKELAVHQAESVMMNPQVSKVRVVEEAFDQDSAEQKFRTVFIRHKIQAKAPEKPASAAPAAPEAAAAGTPQSTAPRARKKPGVVGLSLKFAAIVCAGIALIIVLRHFGATP